MLVPVVVLVVWLAVRRIKDHLHDDAPGAEPGTADQPRRRREPGPVMRRIKGQRKDSSRGA
jgi:hypothetical protein